MKTAQLKTKIKQLENYLGPIMKYNDDGAFKLLKKKNKKDLWIYEYYQILKKRYYQRLKRKKPPKA
jgi:hypothetical protein